MEIQNIFLNIIWFCGFLILGTGTLWMLKTFWEAVTVMRGRTGDKKIVESFIEEINDIDVSGNMFSDKVPDETKD